MSSILLPLTGGRHERRMQYYLSVAVSDFDVVRERIGLPQCAAERGSVHHPAHQGHGQQAAARPTNRSPVKPYLLSRPARGQIYEELRWPTEKILTTGR